MNCWSWWSRFATTVSALTLLQFLLLPRAFQDAPRQLLEASAPNYPLLMREAGIEGTFVAKVTVLPSGEVHNVQILESPFKPESSRMKGYFRRWRLEEQDQTTMHEFAIAYRLVDDEAEQKEGGVSFLSPMTIEIRDRRPSPRTYVLPRS